MLLDQLKTETGLRVSPNTMSKWFSGQARPRPDNIRKIAQVLSIDEVWLSMGKKPAEFRETDCSHAGNAWGVVLLVGGLIEMAGGRVTFGMRAIARSIQPAACHGGEGGKRT